MSAEVLREAASLMRERAESAVPSDSWHRSEYVNDDPHCLFFRRGEFVRTQVYAGDEQTADHIASWHPLVALAVADWLEDEAVNGSCEGCGHSRERCDAFSSSRESAIKCCPDCEHASRAVVVARAYLGGVR